MSLQTDRYKLGIMLLLLTGCSTQESVQRCSFVLSPTYPTFIINGLQNASSYTQYRALLSGMKVKYKCYEVPIE